jgi:ubiquinone/menaquinone biosynthesis C-methylase UbiE
VDQRYSVTGRVDLTALDLPGLVLDVGGGGEGVIGRVLGSRVVAIDRLKSELEDTPAGPLKIVMDARELQFLDASFDAATAFFALMYVQPTDHERLFAEVHRVLRPGAPFIVWDVAIPPRLPEGKEIIMVRPEIVLRDGTLATGYGVRAQGRRQDLDWFVQLAGRTGLVVEARKQEGSLFRLDMRRARL